MSHVLTADYTNLRGERRQRRFELTGKVFPGEPPFHADARWVLQARDLDSGRLVCIDLTTLHACDGREPATPAEGRPRAGASDGGRDA